MESEEYSCWKERELPAGKKGRFLVGSDAASQWEKDVASQWEVMQLRSGK